MGLQMMLSWKFYARYTIRKAYGTVPENGLKEMNKFSLKVTLNSVYSFVCERLNDLQARMA